MQPAKTPILLVLMVVGEGIFLLPFVVTRVFRPTFLTVFEISNLQLGTAFSFYGIVAAFSYFLGGPLADKFRPKTLLISSLIATGLTGVVFASIPTLPTLTLLYGFWGLSTILFFWSAYIKGIRQYGGESAQGKSHGLVDGGRGLFAASIATGSVFLLDALLPVPAGMASKENLAEALSYVILSFGVFVFFCAFLVWLVLPNEKAQQAGNELSLSGISQALKHKAVWYQALILLSAYVGYKCTDDFGLYAKDTFGYDDVASAHIATLSFWVRPIGAILAGYLGDKMGHSRMAMYSFFMMIVGASTLASGVLGGAYFPVIMVSIAATSLGIYGLRGLYYALFQESKIPLSYTGAAIGFIAVIGYTPDIFMGPLMGVLLDGYPGALGHQLVFAVLALFGIVGLVACKRFNQLTIK